MVVFESLGKDPLWSPLSFLDISIPHFYGIVNRFSLGILHDIFNIYVCIL